MSSEDGSSKNADDSESIYRAPASDTSFAPEGDLLSIYVGPKNTDYYLRQFERFQTTGASVSWNWPAFFIASIWLLYRKMWLLALLYWIVLPISLAFISGSVGATLGPVASVYFYYGTSILISFILMPMYANRFYFRHAQKKIDKIRSATTSAEQQAIEVARTGGTSNVALVVIPFILVVVVGILAAIAIPAYQDYTIRAQVSEGLNLAGTPKAAVAEHYFDVGVYPEDNRAAGLAPATELSGMYVSGIAVADGDVLITYGGRAHQALDGKTLLIHPEVQGDGNISWTCSSASISPKHLPGMCR